jgi:hypothetical protein
MILSPSWKSPWSNRIARGWISSRQIARRPAAGTGGDLELDRGKFPQCQHRFWLQLESRQQGCPTSTLLTHERMEQMLRFQLRMMALLRDTLSADKRLLGFFGGLSGVHRLPLVHCAKSDVRPGPDSEEGRVVHVGWPEPVPRAGWRTLCSFRLHGIS